MGASMVGIIIEAAALRRYYCSCCTPSSSLRNPCPGTPDGPRRSFLRGLLALVWDRGVHQKSRHACPRAIQAPRNVAAHAGDEDVLL